MKNEEEKIDNPQSNVVLPCVSGSLSSKDEAVGKGFNNANGSEYNRRNVLRDADDDLYYTGWMDCFDWLVSNYR